MKVISLIQPWASLVANGSKKIETRSWKTNYRGPLFIHASKKVDNILFSEPFYTALGKPGHNNMINGAIIARCNLVDCLEMINDSLDSAQLSDGREIIGNEYTFGDYTPGRYAWILEDAEILETPIPAKGKLGLWEFNT